MHMLAHACAWTAAAAVRLWNERRVHRVAGLPHRGSWACQNPASQGSAGETHRKTPTQARVMQTEGRLGAERWRQLQGEARDSTDPRAQLRSDRGDGGGRARMLADLS